MNINISLNYSETQKFTSILEGFGANLTFHEATLITSDSVTCVDNFKTNLNICCCSTENIRSYCLTLLFSIGEARFKSVTKQIRLVNESTIENFLELLFIEVWDDLYVYQNISDVDLL